MKFPDDQFLLAHRTVEQLRQKLANFNWCCVKDGKLFLQACHRFLRDCKAGRPGGMCPPIFLKFQESCKEGSCACPQYRVTNVPPTPKNLISKLLRGPPFHPSWCAWKAKCTLIRTSQPLATSTAFCNKNSRKKTFLAN